ncbi:MAG: DUF2442 domain-containing protein [Pseudomarimonas sp.]
MNSLVLNFAPRAMAVECSDDELRVSLTDGRWISVPIVWFPRLAQATSSERANYELLGDGQGIHWPSVDEDISVVGLITGQPSVELLATSSSDAG